MWSARPRSSPPISLADLGCVFGADTLIPTPGIPERLHDSGVPSPPSSPAWQDRHYYCNCSRSRPPPDPVAVGSDHIPVLYSAVPPVTSGSLGWRERSSCILDPAWRVALPWAGPLEGRHPLSLPVGSGPGLASGSSRWAGRCRGPEPRVPHSSWVSEARLGLRDQCKHPPHPGPFCPPAPPSYYL